MTNRYFYRISRSIHNSKVDEIGVDKVGVDLLVVDKMGIAEVERYHFYHKIFVFV